MAKLKNAFIIDSDDVTVKNLCVKYLEKLGKFWGAVKIRGLDVQLENIEVYGGISENLLAQIFQLTFRAQ